MILGFFCWQYWGVRFFNVCPSESCAPCVGKRWRRSDHGSGCREILRKSGPNLPLDTQDVTKTEKNRLFGQVFGQGSNHFKTKSRIISARVQEIKLSSIISVNSRNLQSENQGLRFFEVSDSSKGSVKTHCMEFGTRFQPYFYIICVLGTSFWA